MSDFLSFDTFITPKIIRVVFAIGLLLIALGTLGRVIWGSGNSPDQRRDPAADRRLRPPCCGGSTANCSWCSSTCATSWPSSPPAREARRRCPTARRAAGGTSWPARHGPASGPPSSAACRSPAGWQNRASCTRPGAWKAPCWKKARKMLCVSGSRRRSSSPLTWSPTANSAGGTTSGASSRASMASIPSTSQREPSARSATTRRSPPRV